MEEGCGGGGITSSSTSCLMGFGDHDHQSNASLCPSSPMIMMMPTTTTTTQTNTLFLSPQNLILNNRNATTSSSSAASMMLEVHNNNNNTAVAADGCYFMDTSTNTDSTTCSSSVKAKIMSHPHYHRLLAAYINCQKVHMLDLHSPLKNKERKIALLEYMIH